MSKRISRKMSEQAICKQLHLEGLLAGTGSRGWVSQEYDAVEDVEREICE